MNTKRLKNLWKYDCACFLLLFRYTWLRFFEKERKRFDWQSFFLFVFVLEKRNCLWSAHTSSGVQHFKVFPILWGKYKQCHQKRFVRNARLKKSILLYCFYVCSTLENFQLLCTVEFPIRVTSTACDVDIRIPRIETRKCAWAIQQKINTNTYTNHTKNYHTKLLLLKAVVKSVLTLCASEDLLFAQLPFVTQSCLDSWNKRNSFE